MPVEKPGGGLMYAELLYVRFREAGDCELPWTLSWPAQIKQPLTLDELEMVRFPPQ